MDYFAYGSNLNKRAMATRCPGATPVGVATLADFRFCFKRFADIMPSVGAQVVGALWEITPGGLRALDRFEGNDYGQIKVRVTCNGALIGAVAYAMKTQNALAAPTLEYAREIAMGYRDWGLDEALLRRARYDTIKAHTPLEAEKPQHPDAPAPSRRRALWDPAQQSSGTLESLTALKRPKPQ